MIDEVQQSIIQEKVDAAISQARSWEEVKEFQDKEKRLVQQFVDSEISIDEFTYQLDKQNQDMGTIVFYNPTHFKFVLEYLNLADSQIAEAMSEELESFNNARQSSLPTRLAMTFYRDDSGRLVLIPATQVKVVSLMREAAVRAALKRVGLKS